MGPPGHKCDPGRRRPGHQRHPAGRRQGIAAHAGPSEPEREARTGPRTGAVVLVLSRGCHPMAKRTRRRRSGSNGGHRHLLFGKTATLPEGVNLVDVQGYQHNGAYGSDVGLAAGAGQVYQPFVTCTNSTCRGGGYDLEPAILEVIRSRSTNAVKYVSCGGTEPVNRRCGNQIEMSVRVVYEDTAQANG